MSLNVLPSEDLPVFYLAQSPSGMHLRASRHEPGILMRIERPIELKGFSIELYRDGFGKPQRYAVRCRRIGDRPRRWWQLWGGPQTSHFRLETEGRHLYIFDVRRLLHQTRLVGPDNSREVPYVPNE